MCEVKQGKLFLVAAFRYQLLLSVVALSAEEIISSSVKHQSHFLICLKTLKFFSISARQYGRSSGFQLQDVHVYFHMVPYLCCLRSVLVGAHCVVCESLFEQCLCMLNLYIYIHCTLFIVALLSLTIALYTMPLTRHSPLRGHEPPFFSWNEEMRLSVYTVVRERTTTCT